MAENHNTHHQGQDPEQMIENSLGRFELFLERNGKKLLIVLAIVVVAVGGYFSYKHLYLAPRTEKAAAAMFEAQGQFERDSFALALNGNAAFDGFLTIADTYGNTPQGNIAHHYAGLCYLHMGQYQQAVDAFKAYSAVGKSAAGIIVSAQNIGLTGDAYVELGDMTNGVACYEKAAAYSDNIDTAPTYLRKAGLVNESLGNFQKALEQYQSIKNNYPRSMQARDIEKFIARVQQQL